MGVLTFLHRWVGVALALFMLIWFSTGLVIALFGAPPVTRQQQLAHAQTLAPEANWLSLSEALERNAAAQAGAGDASGEGGAGQRRGEVVAEAKLQRIAGAPVWLVERGGGRRGAVSALDGAALTFSAAQGETIARDWANGAALSYLDTVDASVGVRNAENLKPFHRYLVEDGAATIIVVSARTGEIAQVATQWRRALEYAGAWTHLFRWLDLLGAGEQRRDALTYAGAFAAIGAVTGVILGFVKWKPGLFGRPTYARGRVQPYRESWLKYHFWAGLIGGVFALLWASSGFLSTNPGKIFSPAAASRDEQARYRGGATTLAAAAAAPAQISGLRAEDVELSWSRLGDDAALLATTREGDRRAVSAAGVLRRFEQSALLAAAQRLAGATPLAGGELLSEYDSYYFPGHGQTGLEKPLPVLRVDFQDAGDTSLYINPADGALLAKYDTSRRVYRWMYSAAHHWDVALFRRHPWLRSGWIGLWASVGVGLGASAVVLAWRRLRRSLPKRSSDKEAALAAQKA